MPGMIICFSGLTDRFPPLPDLANNRPATRQPQKAEWVSVALFSLFTCCNVVCLNGPWESQQYQHSLLACGRVRRSYSAWEIIMSDMESDCDDVFTDDSKGYDGTKGSPEPEDDGHVLNRKKRRGIIEKRRRDRINHSLSELRRLVPAAYEKQGSAKLEKAEILQMTVDHLRILHSKGFEVLPFDPLVMDYHGIGFRECVSEVARFLVGFEGLDIQDPLRLRLMSHLQCFSAQKDLAVKSPPALHPLNPPSNPWFVVPTPQYPPLRSSALGGDRRLSSNSSAMSVDTNGSNSPRVQHPFRRSTLGSEGKIQRSPVMPYRPWGAEVAY